MSENNDHLFGCGLVGQFILSMFWIFQICMRKACTGVVPDDDITAVKEIPIEEISNTDEQQAKDIPIHEADGCTYYDNLSSGGQTYRVGDFVLMPPIVAGTAFQIGQILSLKVDDSSMIAHIRFFCYGSETILGELADEKELFATNHCEDVEMAVVIRKLAVQFKSLPLESPRKHSIKNDGDQLQCDFWFQMRYQADCARFESIKYGKEFVNALNQSRLGLCPLCEKHNDCYRSKIPHLKSSSSFTYLHQEFSVGDAVMLLPNSFRSTPMRKLETTTINLKARQDKDPNIYTEFYRHANSAIKGSNLKTPKPFKIGVIERVNSAADGQVFIKVRRMFRPEDLNLFNSQHTDVNLLFWSEEVQNIETDLVQGKCFIMPEQLISTDVTKWSSEGQYRFYFNQEFNKETKNLQKLSLSVLERYMKRNVNECSIPFVPALRSMDAFAGCGGLSAGLEKAGIADTKWAIEKCPFAAKAFHRNFPKCNVFTEDCNVLLQAVMYGKEDKRYPQKGDVELLVGGPPCQGFSLMNKYGERDYSQLKNSLIANLLSFCDFYRPKYFILENVKNFAYQNEGLILKLCLRTLIKMGYQCTFWTMQAGQHGVPQSRRRIIIMAAAESEVLPLFPEPRFVFTKTALTCKIDNIVYNTNVKWNESAPFRTITVRDAISDLQQLSGPVGQYTSQPETHFQRIQRKDRKGDFYSIVKDHVCQELNALTNARIANIPTDPGSDWRDLPNISMELCDGTMTEPLQYKFPDRNLPPNHPNRAVCACAAGKKYKCSPEYKQNNTLIPYSLVHTARTHNNWAGLFGRLDWDGFFSTTLTHPHPMRMQGRVLHPEQNRVVSVRECARSQGFHDGFVFEGPIASKYAQIGNAVPPPMAFSLGQQIAQACAKKLEEFDE